MGEPHILTTLRRKRAEIEAVIAAYAAKKLGVVRDTGKRKDASTRNRQSAVADSRRKPFFRLAIPKTARLVL
jgi:hypothetical protein